MSSKQLEAPRLTQHKLQKQQEDFARRGVIYMSYVPQDVQPLMVKQLLSAHGEVTRVFLKTRPSVRQRPQYSEGCVVRCACAFSSPQPATRESWIEFADKRKAKTICQLLNNQPMTGPGQKKKFYSNEMWNLSYLKHVKWADVTDQFAEAVAVRQKQLRLGLAAAKRDASFFAGQVALGNKRRQRPAKRRVDDNDDGNNNNNDNDGDNEVGDNATTPVSLPNRGKRARHNDDDDATRNKTGRDDGDEPTSDGDARAAMAAVAGGRARSRRRGATTARRGADDEANNEAISDALLQNL